MNIKLLDGDDIKKLEDFLSLHKSSCMFICSNLKASGIIYQNSKFHGEYLGYFNDSWDHLEGVIVHYWNGNIMMFAQEINILNKLVASLKNNTKRPVAGILGPNTQAEFVINELGLENEKYNVNRCEGLYEINLDHLDEWKIPRNFSIVTAKKIYKDTLIQWMQDYEIEALGGERNSSFKTRIENKVDGLINGSCWVLLKDGISVALGAFNARVDDMVQVGPVWTPPEYRNQGFSKLLLTNILNEAKRNNINKAILFTDNPAAIKVYEAIGFKIIGDYRLALLKKPVKLHN